jgi:hypothetical protein
MGLSRRDLLMTVGHVGGYSAAFTMMRSLGMPAIAASAAPTVEQRAGSGKGTSVVIPGGIAGLVGAGQLGYTCTLLEARERTHCDDASRRRVSAAFLSSVTGPASRHKTCPARSVSSSTTSFSEET